MLHYIHSNDFEENSIVWCDAEDDECVAKKGALLAIVKEGGRTLYGILESSCESGLCLAIRYFFANVYFSDIEDIRIIADASVMREYESFFQRLMEKYPDDWERIVAFSSKLKLCV